MKTFLKLLGLGIFMCVAALSVPKVTRGAVCTAPQAQPSNPACNFSGGVDDYLQSNVQGSGPLGTTNYNNLYYATPAAAAQLASCLGGSVEVASQMAQGSSFIIPPTLNIKVGNSVDNAGTLISNLIHGVGSGCTILGDGKGSSSGSAFGGTGGGASGGGAGGSSLQSAPVVGNGVLMARVSTLSTLAQSMQAAVAARQSAGGSQAAGSSAATGSGTGAAAPISIEVNPRTRNVAAEGSITYAVTIHSDTGEDFPVTLAVSGLPKGTSAFFSPQQVSANNGKSTLTINILGSAANDIYTFRVVATNAAGDAKSATANITIGATANIDPVLPLATAPSGNTVFSLGSVNAGGGSGAIGSISGSGAGGTSGTGGLAVVPSGPPPPTTLEAVSFGGLATKSLRYLGVYTRKKGNVFWNEIEVYDASGKKLSPVLAIGSETTSTWQSPEAVKDLKSLYDGDIRTAAGINIGHCESPINPQGDCNFYANSRGMYVGWVVLDFGSVVQVSKIRLSYNGSGDYVYPEAPDVMLTPTTAQVVESQDGKNYQKITQFAGKFKDGTWLEYSFADPVADPVLTLTINGSSSSTILRGAPLSFAWNSASVDYIDASFTVVKPVTARSSGYACEDSRDLDPITPLVPTGGAPTSWTLNFPTSFAPSGAPLSDNCPVERNYTLTLTGVQSQTGKTVSKTASLTILPQSDLYKKYTIIPFADSGTGLPHPYSEAYGSNTGGSGAEPSIPYGSIQNYLLVIGQHETIKFLIGENSPFVHHPLVTLKQVPSGFTASIGAKSRSFQGLIEPLYWEGIAELQLSSGNVGVGRYPLVLQSTWRGETKTFTWYVDVVEGSGESAPAENGDTLELQFKANGQNDISVNVGDPITYSWETNGVALDSNYQIFSNNVDTCPGSRKPYTPYKWSANASSSLKYTFTERIQGCQKGSGNAATLYVITLSARGSDGGVVSKVVNVRVRGDGGTLPPAAPPVAVVSPPSLTPDFTLTAQPPASPTPSIANNNPNGFTYTLLVTPSLSSMNGSLFLSSLTPPRSAAGNQISGGFATGDAAGGLSYGVSVPVVAGQAILRQFALIPNSYTPSGDYAATIVAVFTPTIGGNTVTHSILLPVHVQYPL